MATLGDSPVKYASFIQIDDLIDVLTDGVLIFDELQSVIQRLPPAESQGSGSKWLSVIPAARWVSRKDPLLAMVTRLQGFKSSVTCILCILQRFVASPSCLLRKSCSPR